jgi:hypothetical protein
VPEPAELSALLTDHLDRLDHRAAVVHDLRRAAVVLDPRLSGEVMPVLNVVDRMVHTRDESARVLLQWLLPRAN